MTIKEARNQFNISQMKASEITGVPLRTLQSWEMGERKCPDYVERLVVNEIIRQCEKDVAQ